MTMGQLPSGKLPRIQEFKGDIAIWAGEGGDDAIGLVMSPSAAVQSAVAMIAQVAAVRGDDLPMLEVSKVIAEPAFLDDGERAIKMTVIVNDAPLALWLDLTRFAELTASMMVASRAMDRSE